MTRKACSFIVAPQERRPPSIGLFGRETLGECATLDDFPSLPICMNASTPESDVASPSRYLIGIDLGTTNSALCFVDTQQHSQRIQTFAIPQFVAPGELEARETLPSFLYQAAANEFAPGALRLPWDAEDRHLAVGVFAREQGKLAPGRVIESAKSWLCHPGVDRTAPLLPWHGGDDVPRLSPVDASAAYLAHLRGAWNHLHPQDPFEQQEIIVTLPASFDEVARELTVEAAKRAGIPRLVLIEEPQAAFYAWIHAHSDSWNQLVSPGQNILVCDVGGGTSDFTLIRARPHPKDNVQFQRIAVGDHLILGGDNLDLALAHHLEQKLPNVQLDPRQWGSLVRICRSLKETLLTDPAPESLTITLLGTGSRLIGGGLSIEVSRDEARALLLEGYFPRVPGSERPRRQASGFQEFGLPYAPDPAVTRYLASFLADHCRQDIFPDEENSGQPDVLLFNGGVFVSPLIRDRLVDVIADWFSDGDANWRPQVLKNDRHDLAVAQGAAYYGLVRRGAGVRITAGLPRSYYIGVETADDAGSKLQALCLMPAGVEPGHEVELSERTFHLTVAAPVEFTLFHSSLRLTDPAGSLIPIEREQLSPLPPIRTVLRSRTEKESVSIPVHLHARLNEIGTLQIWCSEVDGKREWQLQFDIRSATQTDVASHQGAGESAGVLDEESVALMRSMLAESFALQGTEKPAGLPKRLSRALQLSREQWPPSLLRQMWETLLELEPGRRKSAEHEARWLNLLGYALRPGYGVALDDWRVMETWRLLRGKLAHPGPLCLGEWWILWRRIAGGLPAGQQQALATPLATNLREEHRKSQRSGRSKRSASGTDGEAWRMLGALERLPVSMKLELGQIAADWANDRSRESLHGPLLWSLGRIGSRQLLYGPLNEVVPVDRVSGWIESLISTRHAEGARVLAVMQLARRTGDRHRDIPDHLRRKVVQWLTAEGASEQFIQLVTEGGELADREQALVFGEALPVGLRISG